LGDTWREILRFLSFDLAATFFAMTLLPMIETYIGALSVLKVRELSHPSSPLLRRMQINVPGTYHHCLMIGTLAEAVAGELGMNENLMKMGAYYHDIGKLRRPRFFVENQMGGENIHDAMSPTLSAVAIIAHVREGVELANEFGLPKKVKQFITEHHGTTCLGYFYRKAVANGENVDIGQFCYPGPKPQSRETALLMLLDSAEAAMRAESAKILTVNDIQEVIERVVSVKIKEKQFDDVDFTYKETTLIKAALLKAFQSMYHTRIVKEIKEQGGSRGGQ
jgi:putative nucleotidyltransferase with HDIG domain